MIFEKLQGWGAIISGTFVLVLVVLMIIFSFQRAQPTPVPIASHFLEVAERNIVVSPVGGACYEVLRTRGGWGQASADLVTVQVACPVVAVPVLPGGQP